MGRILVCLLCLGALAEAQGEYEKLLAEAARLEREPLPGDKRDAPLDRAYLKLAEAAQLDPRRWEAFGMRGTNRCSKAVVCRSMLPDLLNEARARGESPESVAAKDRSAAGYIGQLIADARHDFRVMERNMRLAREPDPNRLLFAVAALKYASAQYLEDGAIEDFKTLVQRRWQVRLCSEFAGRCYLRVGVDAVFADDYEGAQTYWDEALRWVQEASTRRMILSNKAAAYEMDNSFGRAEEVLREQIDLEPYQPIHWKNLGLVLGYQGRLHEALYAYAQTRFLCKRASTPVFLGVYHGNAWLKAAMIHGKLLEEDGDLHTAWRLFMEYRQINGDDYNFCLNFGEFCFHMQEYEMAWMFLIRARNLQPFCIVPYSLLLQAATRLGGEPEEAKARIQTAKNALDEARKLYAPNAGELGLNRMCGGVRDRAAESAVGHQGLIDPDPLKGLDADRLPDWITEAAKRRQPFQPFVPPADDGAPGGEPAQAPGPDEEVRRSRPVGWLVAIGLVVVTGVFLLLRRQRG